MGNDMRNEFMLGILVGIAGAILFIWWVSCGTTHDLKRVCSQGAIGLRCDECGESEDDSHCQKRIEDMSNGKSGDLIYD